MENLRFKVGEHVKIYENPKTKKKFLAIELNDENIFATENNTYVNLNAIETKDAKFGETHFIKVPGKWNNETEKVEGLDFICGNIYHVEQKSAEPKVETVEDEDTDAMPF